ncbi:MAG TPA: hypothetical protein VL068_10380 [Microthrixaceae bacterium]|nr:hypothetical protein [Microthrixaceae bacterium]
MPGEPNQSRSSSGEETPGDQLLTRGPQIIAISIGDAAEAWTAAGFTVDKDGSCRISSVEIRLDVAGTSADDKSATGQGGDGGFRSWSFAGIDASVTDIDGLRVSHVDVANTDHTAHPNGVTSLDHIVINSGNPERTVAALEAAGFPLRGRRRATNLKVPMVQYFFWAGDVILELIGPSDSGPGNSRLGNSGPSESATQSDEPSPQSDEPSSIFGLALVSPDLKETSDFLGDLASDPRPAVQKGRRITTLRTRDLGISLPIAVMSPHPS